MIWNLWRKTRRASCVTAAHPLSCSRRLLPLINLRRFLVPLILFIWDLDICRTFLLRQLDLDIIRTIWYKECCFEEIWTCGWHFYCDECCLVRFGHLDVIYVMRIGVFVRFGHLDVLYVMRIVVWRRFGHWMTIVLGLWKRILGRIEDINLQFWRVNRRLWLEGRIWGRKDNRVMHKLACFALLCFLACFFGG